MDIRQEASRGLADIESFLFRQAHLRAARRRVGAFTAEESGLTAEQKEDIERWYVEEQIHVARMVTRHIADRVSAVKEQQHRRFWRWLRAIMTTMTLVTVVMALFVTATLTTHG